MLNKTSKFSRKTRNALSFARPCVSHKGRLHIANEIWAIFTYKILPKENEKIRPGKCPQCLVQDTASSFLGSSLSLFHPSFLSFYCTALHVDLSAQTRHQIRTSCLESSALIIEPGTSALILFSTLHSRCGAGSGVSETRVK